MIESRAPAKINLGLEILGRRDDGFHEIRTVMAPITVHDVLRVELAGDDRVTVEGFPLFAADNSVVAAITLARDTWRVPPLHVTITKRIPLSSGLGGGSSDAAASLMTLARLIGCDASPGDLVPLAARLGSDVPFFLHGCSALVSGRGETVTSIPAHSRLHVVLVVPTVVIPGKTARLYGLLSGADFTDGSAVDGIAADLNAAVSARTPFPNAFRRPLYDLVPALRTLRGAIEDAVGLPAQISGAGPAHYVLCTDETHRSDVAMTLRHVPELGGVDIIACSTESGFYIRDDAHDA